MEKTTYLNLPLIFLKRPRGRLTKCFQSRPVKKKWPKSYKHKAGSVGKRYAYAVPVFHGEL